MVVAWGDSRGVEITTKAAVSVGLWQPASTATTQSGWPLETDPGRRRYGRAQLGCALHHGRSARHQTKSGTTLNAPNLHTPSRHARTPGPGAGTPAASVAPAQQPAQQWGNRESKQQPVGCTHGCITSATRLRGGSSGGGERGGRGSSGEGKR